MPEGRRHPARSLVYIAHARIPSQRTNSLQVMKMCAGFAAAGAATRLVIPLRPRDWFRLRFRGRQVRDWYAVGPTFAITSLAYPNLGRRLGGYGFWAALLARRLRPDLVYTRSLAAACRLAAWNQPVVFETHDLGKDQALPEWRGFLDDTLQRPALRGLVAISQGLAEAYQAAGAPSEKLHVLHDGVDLERFQGALDRAEARSRLGLDLHGRVICHVGNMSAGRGIDVLLRAVAGIPAVTLVLVGGRPEEIAAHAGLAAALGVAERVRFTGYVSNRQVPLYLWAADVLVLAATAASPIAAFTSPLKLFEYMAAGRPMVAAKLATIGEVLRQEDNALLVEAGSAEALRDGIQRLLNDPALGEKLARRARIEVERYSWQARAAAILERFGPGA